MRHSSLMTASSSTRTYAVFLAEIEASPGHQMQYSMGSWHVHMGPVISSGRPISGEQPEFMHASKPEGSHPADGGAISDGMQYPASQSSSPTHAHVPSDASSHRTLPMHMPQSEGEKQTSSCRQSSPVLQEARGHPRESSGDVTVPQLHVPQLGGVEQRKAGLSHTTGSSGSGPPDVAGGSCDVSDPSTEVSVGSLRAT